MLPVNCLEDDKDVDLCTLVTILVPTGVCESNAVLKDSLSEDCVTELPTDLIGDVFVSSPKLDTDAATENDLERRDMALLGRIKVTLLNAPEVTLGDTKDDTLVVTLDVTANIMLSDGICDFVLEASTAEVNDSGFERSGVTLV